MVLEAIYVVRHGVSLSPFCPRDIERVCRMSNRVFPTNRRHGSVIECSRGHFLAVRQHIEDTRSCPPRKKVLRGVSRRRWHSYHDPLQDRTYDLDHTACRETILMIFDSSALTGSSIPKPESTTVPFVHQLASLQTQLSPAMAFGRPSNWHSTSSPPTQRSTQSTQAPSTAVSKPWHLSRLLALHRTPKTPKS